MLKKEIRIFFTALMFFTRIPCPRWTDHSEEYLNKSSRYFSLMGWIVGGISAGVLLLTSLVFPFHIALLLSMIASILVTGAFHEDGFADVCDGFGGGWTREKILLIMKDSRLGTFGTIGLIIALLLKYLGLLELNGTTFPILLIAGHSLSRFTASTFLFTHSYAREDQDSKSKPLATQMSVKDLCISAFFGIFPLCFLGTPFIFIVLIPVFTVKWLLGRYFVKWIGGYTGDCLGAAQQITEILFYLLLIAIPFNRF